MGEREFLIYLDPRDAETAIAIRIHGKITR
jgi:hypothetical protein